MREDIQEYKGKLRIQWKNTECDKYVKEIWVAPAGARAMVNRMVCECTKRFQELQQDSKEYERIQRDSKEYKEHTQGALS